MSAPHPRGEPSPDPRSAAGTVEGSPTGGGTHPAPATIRSSSDLVRAQLLRLIERLGEGPGPASMAPALLELGCLTLALLSRVEDLEADVRELEDPADPALLHRYTPQDEGDSAPPPVNTYAGVGWLIQELARLDVHFDPDTGWSIEQRELERLAGLRRYAFRWTDNAAER